MDAKLGKEISAFAKEAKRLRKILNDTKKIFGDINVTAETVTADLSSEEEFEISSLTKKPPCFLIYGTNNACKACIANSILGSPILPVLWDNRSENAWRTVRLKHGVKKSTSLNLPGSYELVDIDNLISQNKSWDTLPLVDLQRQGFNQDGTPDKAKEAAVLEVNVRSPVLDEGAIVTVLETQNVQCTLKQQYNRYSSDMLPIVIYAVHNDMLDQQNIEELLELKECQLDVTIFFVKVTEQQFQNNHLSPGKRRHGRVSSKLRSVQKLANPMEGIRETLEKNHITADYVQKRGGIDNRNLKNSPQNTGSELQSSIRALLPCRNHNKANCTNCTVDQADDGIPCKVFISDNAQESDSDLEEEEEDAMDSEAQFQLDSTASDNLDESSDNASKDDLTENVDTTQTSNAISLRRQSSQRLCAFNLFEQLLNMGYLNVLPPSNRYSCTDFESFVISSTDSELVENFDQIDKLVGFTHQILKKRLVHAASMLHIAHQRCLQMFIMTAFDMARDMQVTPKKLEFARKKECDLYSGLLEIALKKQDEIKKMIGETIADMREELLTRAEEYDFIGVEIPENGQIRSSKDLKICIGQIQALVLEHLNSTIANKLLSSMSIFKDSYTGVLKRCLESLEKSDTHNADSVRTSLALGEILNAAYQVEITVRAGASVIRILLEKMKQLMHSMAWSNSTRIDLAWKRKVATDMLDSLSEYRLAKSICSQIKERLKQSHETFSSALKQLENRHSGRLERTEEQRLKVRKVHAPRVARLALESISMKDYILYGMPEYGREVGRGQYGVVYSCDSWGGYGPCAVKSVVPPDDKHWNDLALEFHYTKDVPEHERLVSLRGSVIDYSYGGGCSPAVLLVMDRYQRDLYTGIKAGLDWHHRLQVSIDVVEGIRFLHSQGLVHRDIKLKNVLLDKHNRGRLTDLGFCKPEAMMSGSIVGTPIHMAPELFSGKYDSSVDVYAFGILFWYICAGHVKLPYAFEQCTNKEMLWTSVKRGVRPERLSHFSEECWHLMTSCWHGDPDKRPHLGIVQPNIQSILDNVITKLKSKSHDRASSKSRLNEMS